MDTTEPGRGPGHETRDVNFRWLGILASWLAVLLVVVGLLMWWMFRHLAASESASQPPPVTLTAHSRDQLPPEPRLQQDPLAELRELHAEEDAILGSYGWVDQQKRIVRIPIERAMEILVERGLPARQAPAVKEDE